MFAVPLKFADIQHNFKNHENHVIFQQPQIYEIFHKQG